VVNLRRRKRRILFLIFVVLPLFLAFAGGAYFFITYHSLDLTRQLEEPSILYDMDGEQIGRFSSEIRTVVSLDDISPYLIQAIIAIEDSRFYEHFGIDPRGILRALWRNLVKGRIVEGGSTITQQLAENEYFLGVTGPARTLDKKIQEAIYAIKLERNFTKDEILERYLNRIYFGHGRFGVEAASQYYFGKSARELDLSEAALLAGIPKGPGIYSLRSNPELAHQRRDVVLARMEELGYITAQQRQEAQNRVLRAVEHQERPVRASHFRIRVESEVRKILRDLFPHFSEQEISNMIYNQGLTIKTTLSLAAQAAAEQVLQDRGAALREKNPHVQGVIIAIDPASGGIRAIAESIELTGTYLRGDAVYNLGSSFKGALYATALENGFTASSTFVCEETEFPNPGGKPNPYKPHDFDRSWHNRPLRIREALEVSCNVVAVKTGQAVGLDKYLAMIARLNPRLAERNIGAPHLQLPLGPEASPMNLTLTYAPFANGGYSVTPYTVAEILDRDGNRLYQARPQRRPVLDERLAYIVTDMLRGVQGIRTVPFAVAGKTGTASEEYHTVFVGYTSEILATVFFGFDNWKQEGSDIGNAVETAAPAWRDFIQRYYGNKKPPPFAEPAGLEKATVCSDSGLLATHLCPHPYAEIYIPGSAPQSYCTVHADMVEICSATGLPANPNCPAHLRVQVRRQPWMHNLQCWLHGPTPGSGDGEEENRQEESQNDDREQDENNDD